MSVPYSSPPEAGGQKRYGEPEAKRIVKVLKQIADNLDTDEIIGMKVILTQIVVSAKISLAKSFDENVCKFVHVVLFKEGISVNILKQVVRGFLMIKKQPHLGDIVSNKVSLLVAEEFPSLARMGKIDDETLCVYLKALEGGKEHHKHIRLMVVGMFGVGKSCLVRKICNKTIDDVNTTVGIDVLVDACEVEHDGTWRVKQPSEKKNKFYDQRLDSIMSKAVVPESIIDANTTFDKAQTTEQTEASEIHRTPNKKEEERFDAAKERINKFDEVRQPGINAYVGHIVSGNSREVTPKTQERKTSVSIWDFAGQSVYYSTHHFFLSSRSIYLLVLNISKGLDEKVSENESGDKFSQDREDTVLEGCLPEGYTCRDAFRFWINRIYTYTKEETEGRSIKHHPKIVLVGTHKDKLPGTDREKERYKDEYFLEALEPFEGTPIQELIHSEQFFLVSCPDDIQEVFDNIKQTVFEIAKEQPFWRELVPAKWIPLERSIEEKKAMQHKYMQFTDLLSADADTEYPLKDKPAIQLFLRFQHFLGNLLYYNVEKLDQTIILEPQWLIDGFKLFVTHQPTIKINPLRTDWKEYRNHAVLTQQLIDHIIEQSDSQTNDNHFKDYREELIGYMQHLDVMAKPITCLSDEESSPEEKEFFIVPCLLKKIDTNELKSFFRPLRETAKTTPVLCFVFENGFLPPAVFHRLLATCIRKFEISTYTDKRKKVKLLYNGMGVFNLDRQRTLTLWYAEYVIFMRIAVYPATEILRTKECMAVKDEISEMLRTILRLDKQKRCTIETPPQHHDGELYEEYILCENNLDHSVDIVFKEPGKNGLLAVKEFQEVKSCKCECTRNHHGVEQEDALKYWYQQPWDPARTDSLEAVEEWFEEIRRDKGNLDGVPEDEELADISYKIGGEYWDLGLRLGFTQSALERIREDNIYNVMFRIVSILTHWKKEQAHQPSYNVLKDAIIAAKKSNKNSDIYL